jgi:hypothetical protein
VKLRITGLAEPVLVPPAADDELEPLVDELEPLIDELEPLVDELEPLVDELEPLLPEELELLPLEDPLLELDEPDFELPLFDLLLPLLLLFGWVVCWLLVPLVEFVPPVALRLPPVPVPLPPCPDPEPLVLLVLFVPLVPLVPLAPAVPPTVPIRASTSHRTTVLDALSSDPFSTTYSVTSPWSTSTSSRSKRGRVVRKAGRYPASQAQTRPPIESRADRIVTYSQIDRRFLGRSRRIGPPRLSALGILKPGVRGG